MFAYCNNSPIIHADYTGYDAILLINTEFPTHLGALIEDDEGNWWHFYWGPATPVQGVLNVIWVLPVGAKTSCVPYYGDRDLSSINASGVYDGVYSDYLLLEGDFSECIAEAQNASGVYHFAFYSCVHVTLDVLSKADTIYQGILQKASVFVYPRTVFDYLRYQVEKILYYNSFDRDTAHGNEPKYRTHSKKATINRCFLQKMELK